MKKNLFIAIAAAGLMSCGGGPSAEEITKAATDICGCMTEKEANRGETSEDLMESTINFDYALCAFDAAMTGVDPSADYFTTAIDENCPGMKAAQAAYVANAKED